MILIIARRVSSWILVEPSSGYSHPNVHQEPRSQPQLDTMLPLVYALVFLSLGVAALPPRPTVLAPAPDGNDHNKPGPAADSPQQTLQDLIHALDVLQDSYFTPWLGTWPTAIDWTAAVIGTQISAALSTLSSNAPPASSQNETELLLHALVAENLINRFFDQTYAFYYGEDAFSLRMQAFDDMLWVVLGWLESIKFQDLHSERHYRYVGDNTSTQERPWHGTLLRVPAAHRARVFYELASAGWDEELCGGGMIWSPYLLPYKNAITNELFVSASIGMYLFFPGDPIESPYLDLLPRKSSTKRRDPVHLANAIKAYNWLKNSNMTGIHGLYADGFHIHGYENITHPGTGRCDELNTMVYTYNQGVILSGLRGLWMATRDRYYLRDGHELVERVLLATNWPHTTNTTWAGLGRGGVLEEICDVAGDCTQNGHTFKSIFFHHFAEFCRPLRPDEVRFLRETESSKESAAESIRFFETWHMRRCARYRSWVAHNARAALMTRNPEGKFGMWWGRPYPTPDPGNLTAELPMGAIDYLHHWGFKGEDKPLRRPLRDWLHEGGDISAMTSKHRTNAEPPRDVNDRGRGRTVETQVGGIAVVRAWLQWQVTPSLR